MVSFFIAHGSDETCSALKTAWFRRHVAWVASYSGVCYAPVHKIRNKTGQTGVKRLSCKQDGEERTGT